MCYHISGLCLAGLIRIIGTVSALQFQSARRAIEVRFYVDISAINQVRSMTKRVRNLTPL